LRIVLPPLAALFAPLYALVARTGYGVATCRRFGFHPLRVHFYSPVPEYERVPPSHFIEPQRLPGVRIDEAQVKGLLARLGAFAGECVWPDQAAGPGAYYSLNGTFGFSSAALLHSMLRAHGTRRVVEIGGGYSSLISLAALERNGPGWTFACVEPYPAHWLLDALRRPGATLVRAPAETLAPDFCDELAAGDLLFIDSSHVAKLASDVNFLLLQVLPRLKAGVIVHVHDIYLPYEYPAAHFFGENKAFWNEQYLLAALLTGGAAFEVLLPAYCVQTDSESEFRAAFPQYDPARHRRSSSFYLRKAQ
jgi:hypothetical protein